MARRTALSCLAAATTFAAASAQSPTAATTSAANAVICQVTNGTDWSVAPQLGGGFALSPANNSDVRPVMMQLRLAPGQDSIVELPGGMRLQVMWDADGWAEEGDAEDAAFEMPGSFEDLENMGWWGSMTSNMVAVLFICIILGVLAGLEAKLQCIGGAKIHGFIEQNHELQGHIKEVIEMLGLEEAKAAHKNAHEEDIEKGEDGEPVLDADGNTVKKKKSHMPHITMDNPVAHLIIKRALTQFHVPPAQQVAIMGIAGKMTASPAGAKHTLELLSKAGLVPPDIQEMHATVVHKVEAVKTEVLDQKMNTKAALSKGKSALLESEQFQKGKETLRTQASSAKDQGMAAANRAKDEGMSRGKAGAEELRTTAAASGMTMVEKGKQAVSEEISRHRPDQTVDEEAMRAPEYPASPKKKKKSKMPYMSRKDKKKITERSASLLGSASLGVAFVNPMRDSSSEGSKGGINIQIGAGGSASSKVEEAED